MDGIIFVAGLVAGVAAVGIASRRPRMAPGALLTLALVAGSVWFVFI